MKTLNFLLTILTALTLAACSFDKSSDPAAKKNAEDYAYLTDKYSRVTGVYFGTFMPSDGSQTQNLRVTLSAPDSSSGGTDSRGEPVVRPALRARFSFESTTKTAVILDQITYSESTIPPKLLMASSEKGVNPDNVSAQLTADGSVLEGPIKQAGRTFGTASLKLVSRNTNGPADGDKNEENQHLINIYQPLVGEYVGTVNPSASQGEAFGTTVVLSISWIVDPQDKSGTKQIPALVGVWIRDNNKDEQNFPTLKVDYSPDSYPPTLQMVSDGSTTVGAKYETVIIRVTIRGDVLKGTFTGNDRRPTSITLVKKKVPKNN